MKYQLGNQIGGGGEGTIYQIIGNKNLVAKIFKDPKKQQKIRAALPYLKQLPRNFITPLDLIEEQNLVVGFTMVFVDKNHIPVSSLKYDSCGVSPDKKITLFKEIRNGIEAAHKLNTIIGDLNGENILYDRINLDKVFFLDTTGYQTPNEKLNQYYLQPEITDYLYNHLGLTQESDCYSFACLTYELLTGCHPFKGKHPDYKGNNQEVLKQRTINKISVLGNHPGLIVPKSHKTISDKYVFDQFFSVFEKGERFLISFDKKVQLLQTLSTVSVGSIEIKEMFSGKIEYFAYNDDKLTINNTTYNLEGRGWFTTETRKGDWWCGAPYLVKDGYLWRNQEQIKSINLYGQKHRFIGDSLLSVGDEDMCVVDLTTCVNNNLKYTANKCVGASFNFLNGVFQCFGGKSHLQVSKNGKINTVTLDYQILDFYQFENYLSIKYKENNQILYGYCGAENHAKVIAHTDDLKFSTIKGDYVLEPQDDKIAVLRKQDFKELSHIPCNKCYANSVLISTKGGLVIKNEDEVVLMNTK